jgi:hypothetical protein
MILPFLAPVLLALATAYAAIVSFRGKPAGEGNSWFFPDRAKRSVRIIVGALTVVLVVVAWFGIPAQNASPRSLRFLIPEGYSGWVRVEFEVPDAPHLSSEADQTVLKIPAGGVLRTSAPEQYGWALDSYYFYSAAGTRQLPDSGPARLIWGKINGQASGSAGSTRKYEEFFVGTEQQYKDQANGTKPGDAGKDTRPTETNR